MQLTITAWTYTDTQADKQTDPSEIMSDGNNEFQ